MRVRLWFVHCRAPHAAHEIVVMQADLKFSVRNQTEKLTTERQ